MPMTSTDFKKEFKIQLPGISLISCKKDPEKTDGSLLVKVKKPDYDKIIGMIERNKAVLFNKFFLSSVSKLVDDENRTFTFIKM